MVDTRNATKGIKSPTKSSTASRGVWRVRSRPRRGGRPIESLEQNHRSEHLFGKSFLP